jgi:integrase
MAHRLAGRRGWYFRLDFRGKTFHRYGGETKAAAEMAKHRLQSELEAEHPQAEHDDLNQFIMESYWPAQTTHLTPRGAERELGIIDKHLGPFFAGPMRLITRERILAYVNKRLHEKPEEETRDRRRRLRPISSETVRKELVTLKHVLRIAVKLRVLARNPFDDIESKEWPSKGQERTRHLVGDEWSRLLTATPEGMRSALIVMVNSGMRRGELMGLEHADLNAQTGMGWIAKTKGGARTGKGRWVRFTHDMVELLQAQPRQKGSRLIFWQFSSSQLSVEIGRAVKRAGLENFRLHDLRHSFATSLREQGCGIDLIAKLLGHSDLRMTARYAHLGSRMLDDAVATIVGKYSGKVH